MMRKDCDQLNESMQIAGTRRLHCAVARHKAGCVAAALVFASFAVHANAGTLRVWSSAVVVHDSIRLDEVCEIKGFTPAEQQKLAEVDVAESPVAGGSRVLAVDQIRSAIKTAGFNLAKVTLLGSTQCEISRPSAVQQIPSIDKNTPKKNTAASATTAAASGLMQTEAPHPSPVVDRSGTLRTEVFDYFHQQFSRYGGRAEVILDRTPDSILDLSGPAYSFNVRPRSTSPIGLCSIEVEVIAGGKIVQSIPMVAQVTLVKEVVVARRAINQGATIGAADVHRMPLSFQRLDRLGLDDVAQTIGQRAKQMIPAGSTVEGDMLDAVPLVMRGQLVTLISACGGVRIVTSAKATQEGKRGEVIKVRSADDKHLDFDAVVTGPGEVRVANAANSEPRLAGAR